MLLYEETPVIKGVIVRSGDVVHGRPIKDNHVKVLIQDLLNTWKEYDPDYHHEGTYIQWPKGSITLNTGDTHAHELSILCEGESIMSGQAESYLEMGLKRGRKRKRDPSTWKVVRKRTESRQKKGVMKEGCRDKPEEVERNGEVVRLPPCRLRCCERISEEQRRKTFDHYWALENPQRRWDFISSNVKIVAKKRTRKRKESG